MYISAQPEDNYIYNMDKGNNVRLHCLVQMTYMVNTGIGNQWRIQQSWILSHKMIEMFFICLYIGAFEGDRRLIQIGKTAYS